MIKKTLAAILFVFPSLSYSIETEKLFSLLSPSIWLVRTYDADGIALGAGSAVVISNNKLLTNCHVLRKAMRFEIVHLQQKYPAKLEFIDAKRDMCQIATIDNLNAPAVEIGDSSRLAVGNRVFAIGNPRGLERTLSSGLITALRSDSKGAIMPTLRDDLENVLIQTDTAISPGSSGGGLFSDDGKLIGITTSGFLNSQNLNFAIPINWIKDLPARSKEQIAQYRSSADSSTETSTNKQNITKTHIYKTPPTSTFASLKQTNKLPLTEKYHAGYAKWLNSPGPRAFAISEDGLHYSYTINNEKSQYLALTSCEKNTKGGKCWLYAVDENVVWNENPEKRIGLNNLEFK